MPSPRVEPFVAEDESDTERTVPIPRRVRVDLGEMRRARRAARVQRCPWCRGRGRRGWPWRFRWCGPCFGTGVATNTH